MDNTVSLCVCFWGLIADGACIPELIWAAIGLG
jgi:hypothetical protein